MNDNISRKTRLTTTVGQSVLLRPIVIVGIAYSLSQHFDAVDVIFTHKFISFLQGYSRSIDLGEKDQDLLIELDLLGDLDHHQ